MAGFGDWLSTTNLELHEIAILREVGQKLGNSWPTNSTRKQEYDNAIRKLEDNLQADALSALYRVWPVFEIDSTTNKSSSKLSGLLDKLASSAPTLGVVIPGVTILAIFLLRLFNVSLVDLGKVEISRGLLTLLFGVTTVGIAIIVVLANFLSSGSDSAEADKRFQRGKDILTVLIGVFGAILGYYFGSDQKSPSILSDQKGVAQQAEQGVSSASKSPTLPSSPTDQNSKQAPSPVVRPSISSPTPSDQKPEPDAPPAATPPSAPASK